ncbi:MAG: ATP-binding protein [Halanaerobiales bacterium]
MPERKIINIDESKCNGCGNCVTGCKEGAIQIINGKAKLINEEFCDGFGDCIGECPTGALKIEERQAKDFNLTTTREHVKSLRGEEAVREMMEAQKAHTANSEENLNLLNENNSNASGCHGHGCPGSRVLTLEDKKNNGDTVEDKEVNISSNLNQWPVQIHLLSPVAPYFNDADLLVAADCVPVAYGNFQNLIKDKTIAIGCPKLDESDRYVEKLSSIIRNNNINSITVARMEVPCCGGLVNILQKAIDRAESNLNLEIIEISIKGKVKN